MMCGRDRHATGTRRRGLPVEQFARIRCYDVFVEILFFRLVTATVLLPKRL